ncbi:MAG: valine--tRNA ligase, partial [Gordonia sp. (in: high G+C Gram-positive bacteria)]
DAHHRIEDTQRLITEVRRFRSDQGLKPSQRVAAELIGLEAADLVAQRDYIDSLARLSTVEPGFAATATIEVRLRATTVTVQIDTSGTIDVAAEKRRLEKELVAAEKELATTTGKLANEQFMAKAPDHVKAKIQTRAQVAEEEIVRIKAKLTELDSRS